MLTGPRGRRAPLALVAVLLLPGAAAVAGAPSTSSPVVARPASGDCLAPGAPALGVDTARACRAVRRAVPSWQGTAQVVLVDGDAEVAADVVGSTVRVHPATWESLSPEGRQAVLTHELVHVATDALTTPRTPAWLVEGLAEAIAWRDVRSLPDRVVAEELASDVRARRLPTALPGPADFASRPAKAYQESWLAVDLLLRQLGAPRVLQLYRDAGRMPLGQALREDGTALTAPTRSGASAPDLVRRAETLPPPGAARGPVELRRLVAAWRVELVRRLG